MSEGVSYFGSYDPNYSRNRIIIKGLEKNGVAVCQCQAQGLVIFRYLKLLRQFLKCRNKINTIIVGFPGHYDIPFAYVLGKVFGKKVFFDIFASTYETYVQDREVVKKNSLQAKLFYILDWLGLILCDYVIVDTKSHAKFYSKLYSLKSNKFIAIYLGSDPDYFYPRKVKEETDVLFYGSYQPLQGTEIIVRAASKLPKIQFRMIGNGQTRAATEKLSKELNLKNIKFIDWLPLEKLAIEISKSRITLGIFGRDSKADAVIPNKVYDAIASKKVIITSDTPAAREILINGVNAILLSPDPKFLARAIANVFFNKRKRNSLSQKGYTLFVNKLIPKLVVKSLLSKID